MGGTSIAVQTAEAEARPQLFTKGHLLHLQPSDLGEVYEQEKHT
jgi:hypothetical protein